MSIRVTLSIVFMTLGMAQTATGADDPRKPKPCEARHILVPHKPPGYDFATTSWERAEKNVFVYRTCAENHDGKKSLYIDWSIPGPHKQYIAPSDSNVNPRAFVTHKSADIVSCLIYGNSRQTMAVQYIGHDDDLARAKQEGCSGPRAQVTPVNQVEEPWFEADGRISVPSNSEDVDGTLIRFVYQIGLIPAAGGYRMLLAYEAAPVSLENFRGKIEAITIRPSVDSVRQGLIKSDHKDGLLSLSKYVDRFEIPMELRRPFSLREQQYGFYDINGKLVGEIDAPFLSSVAPR
jgi:hypothetical protein